MREGERKEGRARRGWVGMGKGPRDIRGGGERDKAAGLGSKHVCSRLQHLKLPFAFLPSSPSAANKSSTHMRARTHTHKHTHIRPCCQLTDGTRAYRSTCFLFHFELPVSPERAVVWPSPSRVLMHKCARTQTHAQVLDGVRPLALQPEQAIVWTL